jgi:hypothetical protein
MHPLEVDDDRVHELLNEVAAAKREASLRLIDAKFGERDRVNAMKRKRNAQEQ